MSVVDQVGDRAGNGVEVEVADRRCGTCALFVFGMRSYCGWEWTPGTQELSAAFRAGGAGHAMWVNDGKDCDVWELNPDIARRGSDGRA